ncbi:MAG: hypothetical protein HOG03_07035 [Desulfobacula sp.]|jgi:hypothetical protein|uniref:hypothetical protein n=1 Tax=Desulfobacula sp. TaxID=2593537 RepID=UPI001D6BDC72|nr:hypothetical protein [Desulfobacula sp.]MBT3487388.1 hypothetical protein [Desulfobacula sp.]MBT3804340.1 hypothetical protein [Desulfobacula sp.]MBT4026860.1 hypothetical protein [Desulfobacula sp.]MBT4198533.1 hypothetical protein [Desulfobacula sp.]
MGTITSFIQTWDGEKVTLEQKDIVEVLKAQSTENQDRIELSKAIQIMEDTPKIKITLPSNLI